VADADACAPGDRPRSGDSRRKRHALPLPGSQRRLLLRTAEDDYVAYSQKCTHLSCAVYPSTDGKRLECPCHEGYFSVEDGRVLQGPPPRPLPRVAVERRGGTVWAVGVAARAGES